jgi:hypothetical protein
LWGSKTHICRNTFVDDCDNSLRGLVVAQASLLGHQAGEGPVGGQDVEMVCLAG